MDVPEINLTEKEILLRIAKNYGKKKRPKCPRLPKLTVGRMSSTLLAANLSEISYKNTPSIGVRYALRHIVDDSVNN